MNQISNFLSHSSWRGISVKLAIAALMLALLRPRKIKLGFLPVYLIY